MKRPLRLGLCLSAPLLAVALLGPLLANDRPIFARLDGRACFPALGQLPLIGRAFEQPRFRGMDWSGSDPRIETILRTPVPHGFARTDPARRFEPPGREHLLGTDGLGRDVLARLIRATRISVSVGLLATGIALAIGTLIGLLAGFYGGPVDALLSRLIEVVLCFPTLFFILALIGLDPPLLRGFSDLTRILIVVGLTAWTGMARLARAEILRLCGTDIPAAARASGAGDLRILARHLLPNALTPILVAASFFVAHAILLEAAISFLGFGIQPPEPSWGSMLNEAQESVALAWWLALFPGGALFLAVLGANLIGEGLRASLDPRSPGPAAQS